MKVFLSASVPLPTRDRRFYETTDVIAIREAIKALVEAVLPQGTITSGGHPAITPLISLFIREAGLPKNRLTIFQSRYYEGRYPAANEDFADVRIVNAVAGDEKASQRVMREAMLASEPFDVAVLIGGMEGVIAEAQMFAAMHPEAPMLPIASTGAASKVVFEGGDFPAEFQTNLTYPTLFRRYLPPAH